MATIHERYDSRETTVSFDRPAAELLYWVEGTESDLAVKTLVEATIPAIYAGLVYQEYRIYHRGGGLWDVSVRYGSREQNEVGTSNFSFETGGGTQHITQSLETLQKKAPPDITAPDFQGAIGVTGDAIEGTDIVVPVYTFTETHYIANSAVTGAYKAALFALTGRVNGATFRGFEAGEVLFLGASGSKRGAEDWEITFRFAASPNVTGIEIGEITGIDKRGWDYLWVRYVDDEHADTLVKRPASAYVERVYEDGDFSNLGIGTS
jgi:hypothetical protein